MHGCMFVSKAYCHRYAIDILGAVMGYRRDLWEIAAPQHGVVKVSQAEDAGVPAVEVRKLASRGALQRYGQGVYLHREVPTTRFTQPALAAALSGHGAFLQREAVFDLLDLGQFNPKQIQVGTRRRVRRVLPEWVALEYRPDVSGEDLTVLEGVACTTVERALREMRARMPRERRTALAELAVKRELVPSAGINLDEGALA